MGSPAMHADAASARGAAMNISAGSPRGDMGGMRAAGGGRRSRRHIAARAARR